MVQNRLIGASFLLAMTASLAGFPPELPRGTEMRSLLGDLAPDETIPAPQSSGLWQFLTGLVNSHESSERCAGTSLKTLSVAEADFRGCDREWNQVVEAPTTVARTGCHVNDFWTANVVGLYTLTSAAVGNSNDPAIKLIEISVATAEPEDP